MLVLIIYYINNCSNNVRLQNLLDDVALVEKTDFNISELLIVTDESITGHFSCELYIIPSRLSEANAFTESQSRAP